MRIHEERIGDNGSLVVAFGLPLGELHPGERGCAGRAPVQILFQCPVAVAPDAAQHLGDIAIDNVARGGVVTGNILATALELAFGAQGEHVVADDVVLAVVLEQRAGAHPIDDVMLDQDLGAAFVRLDA